MRNSLPHLVGTHLTLDLDGNVKFGPDVEWLKAPMIKIPDTGAEEEEEGFWTRELQVEETDEKLDLVFNSVQRWLPGVVRIGFHPDCECCPLILSATGWAPADQHLFADVGIRPKLSRQGEKAADFSITHPFPGFIHLSGIESPGLTSSLAIGQFVEELVAREIWRPQS